MDTVLLATSEGCILVDQNGNKKVELSGRNVSALSRDHSGAVLAVVGGGEIWRRRPEAVWTHLLTTEYDLNAIVSAKRYFFAAAAGALILRITSDGTITRLSSFEKMAGRDDWFAQGPPLHIRSLAFTADQSTLVAAVHVGGLPHSGDDGESWAASVPIDFDVHEVKTHKQRPNIIAAAAAVGLCVSINHGKTWRVLSQGPEDPHSLSLAFLEDAILFSVQDGPFALKSQIWRWKIGADRIEHVNDGLPDWLEGKVDTAQMSSAGGSAAIKDGGGHLWLYQNGSPRWQCIASKLGYANALLLL